MVKTKKKIKTKKLKKVKTKNDKIIVKTIHIKDSLGNIVKKSKPKIK